MKLRALVIGVATIGTATALLASAGPALAYPGYTLTSGNSSAVVSSSATISYRATQSTALTFGFASGGTITCGATSGSTLGGSLSQGVYTSGLQFGTVTTSRFGSGTWNGTSTVPGSTPCLSSGGIPVSTQHVGTWQLKTTNPSAPTSGLLPVANQVTPVALASVNLKFHLGSCTFDVVGPAPTVNNSVNGTYRNTAGTGTLVFTTSGSALRVANAPSTGCAAGAIANGGAVTFSGSYSVSAIPPAVNAIWLKA